MRNFLNHYLRRMLRAYKYSIRLSYSHDGDCRVAVAGVTFGDILISDVLSEKVTFPFKALKSDMIVFLAIPLSFGYHDHKGYGNNRNQDTCYDISCQRFSEDQCADQNRCDWFKDSQDGSFGSSDISGGYCQRCCGYYRWKNCKSYEIDPGHSSVKSCHEFCSGY